MLLVLAIASLPFAHHLHAPTEAELDAPGAAPRASGLLARQIALWETDLGEMQTRGQFGEGATPALHGDTLVVPWDHEGDSFVVALDAKTGDEKWRVDRDEPTTWATPLVVPRGDGFLTQPLVNLAQGCRSINLLFACPEEIEIRTMQYEDMCHRTFRDPAAIDRRDAMPRLWAIPL